MENKEYFDKLNQELKNYAEKLLDNGFRVFVYKSSDDMKITWFVFSKYNKIGSVQVADFGGLQFSTKHKPSIKVGTGYLLNYDIGISNPTVKNAEETFVDYPIWAKKKDIPFVIKYASIEEYLKSESVLEYVEIKK